MYMYRIFNDLFYGRSYSAGPGEVSIAFPLDEKATVVAGWLGRRAVGTHAKGPLSRRSLRTQSAVPSACFGRRFLRSFGIDRNRRAGARARVGRPKWLRILTITAGSSMAAAVTLRQSVEQL